VRKHDELIIEEFGMLQGSSRIDVAVVNGSLHGFEIKSDHDTLGRLRKQASDYSRVLQFVTLVTTEKHISPALKVIPKWWGVMLAAAEDDAIVLQAQREGRPNPTVDPLALVQLLWREEAAAILASTTPPRGLTRKPRKVLWEHVASAVPLPTLPGTVCAVLKRRSEWRSTWPAG
jgi:hypothetical protein